MKAVWQGAIAFGLVNIPVKLYTAAEPKELGFRLLCGKCHTPLRYKRYCPGCEREVAWPETVKGLQVGKRIFPITRERLAKLKPERTDFIDIIAFIDAGLIDPIYFAKNYYVMPSKAKEKAYFLFREVLSATAKAALAKFVMRDKEHIALIRAYKAGMLLTTLHYKYEIRSIAQFAEVKEKVPITAQELKLASQLIKKFTKATIDLGKFRDTFAEKLKALVLGKYKPVKFAKPKPKKLLEALQLSVKPKKKK